MHDNKPDSERRGNDTPFENSYQVWGMPALLAVLPSVIQSGALAGGNGWWFCVFIIGLLITISLTAKFKHLFSDAKWFRTLVMVNIFAQSALLLLSIFIPIKFTLTSGFLIAVSLLLWNIVNIIDYIRSNKIPD